MKRLERKGITLSGELAFRVGRNYSRLEDPMYRPERIFAADKMGWPGDWEGRTLLALCLNESLSGRKAAYLDAIVEALDSEWNALGYLKDISPEGIINEQQLAGHNWLLRALLELYGERRDEKFLVMARRIVENLYLPLRGRFSSYPIEAGSRPLEGGAAGHITGEIQRGWSLSSDIGCAFISFDGLAQYYQLLGGERLKDLLDEMFTVFSAIDLVACSVQTHATLSALRGILRYYEASGDSRLLSLVEKRFALYLNAGLTENYANYNWFGRPYWTEPCAIVDSYMLSIDLFRLTKNSEYVVTANRIYYNALLASQRHNGGFGCDMCSGTAESAAYLQVKEGLYEAYWCCSMRGAEGLSSAACSNVLVEGDEVYIANYISGEFRANGMSVIIQSRYPYENRMKIRIHGIEGRKKMHLYIPQDAQSVQLYQDGALSYVRQASFLGTEVEANKEIVLEFATLRKREKLIGALSSRNGFVEWKGDLIVGLKADGSTCLLCDRMYGENDGEIKLGIIRGADGAV